MRSAGLVALIAVLLLVPQAQAKSDERCISMAKCALGYEPYFSHLDEFGCEIYGCRPANMPTVSVSIHAEPSEAQQNQQIFVGGKVSLVSDGRTDSIYRLKIITQLSDAAELSSGKPSFFASKSIQEGMGKEEQQSLRVVDSVGKAFPAHASSSGKRQSFQERIDYMTLSSGESASISAYFTAISPGVKFATISVYYLFSSCNSAGACSEQEHLVGQARAKVKVRAEQSEPPLPPQDEAKFVLNIKNGWNMVSLPVNSKLSMKELSGKCGTSAQAWLLLPSGYSKEEYLEPGAGYWIKGRRSCEFEVSAPAYSLSLKPLFPGWNLVGAPSSTVKISEYSGDCKIISGPWHYDTSAGASPYAYSQTLEPGKAYWIKVGSSCRLYGNLEEAPPMPPN
ncbi:MAG: hypothetical protein N3F07_00520 [Candidatus Micrarchaeota archaeon]|nr:hypothetical protein [Candidatus Micrarchaeota archaeon]